MTSGLHKAKPAKTQPKPTKEGRTLRDLVSVGPSIAADFTSLGIKSVAELSKHEPQELYRKLCRKSGTRIDPCVLDTFCAAIAQARDPKLPLKKCQWWYWSRVRKTANAKVNSQPPLLDLPASHR